ncbi:flippase [Halorarius litoreus]|uniref:flippase n=1 Tax=Halorarius litoreus TaxID=2962676 RepID=UPI0020CD526B|nr:flippase [Halorarius litoreus]
MSDASLKERLASGLKATFAAQLLTMTSSIVLVILLTREFLTPGEFGLLFFGLSVLGVINTFASLGIPKSTARYVNEYGEKDPTQIRYIMRRSLVYLLVFVLGMSVALALVATPLADLLGEPDVAPLLQVGALYVVATSATSYLNTMFQGFNHVSRSAMVSAISAVGRVVFAVGFVALGFGVTGALLGYIAGDAIAAVVGGILLYREHYSQFEETTDPEPGLARRILEYSIPLTATKAANVLDKRVDIILLGVLLNPVAVGYYVVAKQVSNVLSTPAGSFGFTISPAYSEQKAKDRAEHAARLYETAFTYVLLFYIPAGVGLILVADSTIRVVFGADYLPAVPVVQVFSAYILVYAINKITSDGLDFLGRARERSVVLTATSVANFGLNLVLIPEFGVIGAAVATVVTNTVYTLSNVYLIHQELPVRTTNVVRNTALICGITVAMTAAIFPVLGYVSGPLTLAGVVLLGGGIWAVLSLASGLVDVQRVKAFL